MSVAARTADRHPDCFEMRLAAVKKGGDGRVETFFAAAGLHVHEFLAILWRLSRQNLAVHKSLLAPETPFAAFCFNVELIAKNEGHGLDLDLGIVLF